ncbi:hypothetical protein T12_2148 [Trichinella patagoniensis]|uniref:Uncharacterized protein n=1 Tax=Trichinella patagoniensis TaxID=990121 RepID=A0A0V0Z1B1_9BILA|nr:hypothetical protein T12_15114 [Trichinella patagoniensis]KRY06240.1 hypothetical protein T12_2148 [Trichinella patagoniensis]
MVLDKVRSSEVGPLPETDRPYRQSMLRRTRLLLLEHSAPPTRARAQSPGRNRGADAKLPGWRWRMLDPHVSFYRTFFPLQELSAGCAMSERLRTAMTNTLRFRSLPLCVPVGCRFVGAAASEVAQATAIKTAVSSCLSSFRESLLNSRIHRWTGSLQFSPVLDYRCATAASGENLLQTA